MTSETKAILILLIGTMIYGLIRFGWKKEDQSNKIIADVVGVVGALVFIIFSSIKGNTAAGIIVLVGTAIAIIVLLNKNIGLSEPLFEAQDKPTEDPERQIVEDEATQFERELLDVEPCEPEINYAEPGEPELLSVEPVEPEHEMVVPDFGKQEEPDPEIVIPGFGGSEEPELFESTPATPELEELEPMTQTTTYQDGIIGAPVKPKESKPAGKKAGEPQDEAASTEGSEESYMQYIQEKLSDSSAQRNMGIALKNKGKVDEAIEKWREATRINPDDFKAHNLIAKALKETGLLDEASEEFKKVVKINPKVAEAHYALGFDYSARGMLKEAISSFEDYVKCAPPQDAETVDEVKRMIEHLLSQLQAL